MNTGDGKGHHLDMLTAILQKVALGNTMAMVGLLGMEEVLPLQAMEDGLHQDRHLHPGDMEDNLPGLLRPLEATEEDLHLEDMGEGHHHLNRQFPEAMAETLCQAETTRMRGKKPRQVNNQYNLTEMNLLRHYRSSILVTAR